MDLKLVTDQILSNLLTTITTILVKFESTNVDTQKRGDLRQTELYQTNTQTEDNTKMILSLFYYTEKN